MISRWPDSDRGVDGERSRVGPNGTSNVTSITGPWRRDADRGCAGASGSRLAEHVYSGTELPAPRALRCIAFGGPPRSFGMTNTAYAKTSTKRRSAELEPVEDGERDQDRRKHERGAEHE